MREFFIRRILTPALPVNCRPLTLPSPPVGQRVAEGRAREKTRGRFEAYGSLVFHPSQRGFSGPERRITVSSKRRVGWFKGSLTASPGVSQANSWVSPLSWTSAPVAQ
jgi:hypothetical protein